MVNVNKGFIQTLALVLIALAIGGGTYYATDKLSTAVQNRGLKFGAPVSNIFRNLLPETDDKYYIGTTTATNLRFKALILATTTTGCATFGTVGELYSTGSACGTGAGGAVFDWKQENDSFGVNSLTPTTTIPIHLKSTATSTLLGDIQTTGLSAINYISAPRFLATSTTATSTFEGGLTLNGTGVVLNQGTPANTLVTTARGYVGIGTAGPSVKLSVNGNMIVGSGVGLGTISIGAEGSTRYAISGNTPVNNALNIRTLFSDKVIVFDIADVEKVRIDTSGNLGIGTTNPLEKLSVVGNQLLTGDLSLYGGDFNLGTGFSTTTLTTLNNRLGIGTTSPWALFSLSASSTDQTHTPLFVVSTTSPTASTTAFVIDSQGRVGIGTTTPTNQLGVQGSILASKIDTYDGAATSTFAGGALFATGGGNVGIGTTTPAVKLDVNGYVKPLQTSTTTACSAAIQGSMFYNEANDAAWVCGAGSNWKIMGAGGAGGSGTVTSVDMSVPTGLTIGGNPITGAGTLALTYTSGYSIPTTIKQNSWDDKWDLASSTIGNAYLTNSTISGVALGSNLANLTATNGSLTFSATYNGSAAATIGLNLANANSWTGLQLFGNTGTTTFAGGLRLTGGLSATQGIEAPFFNATSTTATSTVAGGINLQTNGTASVNVGTTSGKYKFTVSGDSMIASPSGQAASSTIYIFSTAASKGGSIIMEDSDGAGCSELSVLNGVIKVDTVTCPTIR